MVIREKSLSRIILFFLLCMIASPLVSCSREKNIYRQITDPKEIEARAIKNIDKYLWMFNWTKNENGHLLPEESIRVLLLHRIPIKLQTIHLLMQYGLQYLSTIQLNAFLLR